MKLFVLLPSYNEEQALPSLLKSLYDTVKNRFDEYEVVVINDGSTDGTENAAKLWEGLLNIKIINHKVNKGLGEAVNTGLSYFSCQCSDEDAAVLMDADNTHNPELMIEMVKNMESGKDVVIASRYQAGGEEIGLTALRKICSKGANFLLSLAFNLSGVKDYTCGYRLYSGRTIKKAYEFFGDNFVEEKGFTCMAEIIVKLHYIGCEIGEVPLVLRYDLKKGRSKMKVLKTIGRYFTLIRNCRHYKHSMASVPAFIEGKEK